MSLLVRRFSWTETREQDIDIFQCSTDFRATLSRYVQVGPDAFNIAFQLLDGLYFSIITTSGSAIYSLKALRQKLAVCGEIVFGYFLTVILFFSFAGLAFRKAANEGV
jgi:hypothetical protein